LASATGQQRQSLTEAAGRWRGYGSICLIPVML
jgi:hypothetical protein